MTRCCVEFWTAPWLSIVARVPKYASLLFSSQFARPEFRSLTGVRGKPFPFFRSDARGIIPGFCWPVREGVFRSCEAGVLGLAAWECGANDQRRRALALANALPVYLRRATISGGAAGGIWGASSEPPALHWRERSVACRALRSSSRHHRLAHRRASFLSKF